MDAGAGRAAWAALECTVVAIDGLPKGVAASRAFHNVRVSIRAALMLNRLVKSSVETAGTAVERAIR